MIGAATRSSHDAVYSSRDICRKDRLKASRQAAYQRESEHNFVWLHLLAIEIVVGDAESTDAAVDCAALEGCLVLQMHAAFSYEFI